MNRIQILDSRLNVEEQTSPPAPRRFKPSINGHPNHRDEAFGEDIETRDPHVVIKEDRDARKPAPYDVDNESTEPADGEKQIDDPIRIYLMQLSKFPMLSRIEEIEVAKRIAHSRRRFRYGVLGTDYILQAAIGLMEKLRQGSLRLDRCVEVSVNNIPEKRRIMGVLGPNLRTLEAMVERNRADFLLAVHKRHPLSERRAAWRRLTNRRLKAARLIEELERQLGGPPTAEVSQPFSLRAEEQRQEARGRKRAHVHRSPDATCRPAPFSRAYPA
jgi:RNA polymerase primary sigma factor